jgi:hypothetical protein
MLSHLDRILFPDRCEVIEVIPSQRYVYPIFKNASSSIQIEGQRNGWRVRFNEQIRQIDSIDVLIRNPRSRLISGMNSFIKITTRDNPELDPATVEWFALNYLYLNNHYCPQFMWLINLSRFTKPEAKLNLLSMSDLNTITDFKGTFDEFGQASPELIEKINQLTSAEMYQRIDSVVFSAVGQSMTFEQLWNLIKTADPEAYEYVIGYAQRLLLTTHALS